MEQNSSFDNLSDYLSFPTFMEMFKGDMTIPDLYGSLINISTKKHPLRLAFRETFLDTDIEGLFNKESFF
jgi:hypothetical protein